MSKRKKHLFKVIIVGDGGVGKSTMVQRLITGKYIAQKITIGTDLATYSIERNDATIVLQLWDFAGERRFRFFLPNYSRGATGCLLCYDITRRNTFKNLEEWYDIVQNNASNPVIYLVGCKQDLAEKKRGVLKEDALDYKEKMGFERFFETSSKTGYHINPVYEELIEDIIEKKDIII
ncbi:MAG: GTP-binding protein [Promethearchaeota archaeon]|nr:MAG: GTP-binding protein [Candidatus Lokiarchaeota archaeon]